MILFEIGTDFKVKLNKDWLLLIPQFARLIRRDRGSKNDIDGRKKFQTIRELTFIYHFCDPRSPIENIDDQAERREKALQYAELVEKDIDSSVQDAQNEYEYLLDLSVPTLGLLRSVKGTLSKLKGFFDRINFDKVDKQGKLLYTPESHIKNVTALGKLHKEVMAFEEIVLAELKAQKTARGKMELGDREQSGKKRKWNESDFNPHRATRSPESNDSNPEALIQGNGPDFRRVADMAALQEAIYDDSDDVDEDE